MSSLSEWSDARDACPTPASPSSTHRSSPPKPADAPTDPGEISPKPPPSRGSSASPSPSPILLHRRGHAADDVTRRFLDPRLSQLTSPDAMADREPSAERIARAVLARERVAIFGDYDCDGITSTALLTGVLRALGGNIIPLLATRREGAYGLSSPALERVLAARPSLLITCDCGSSDHERLERVRAAGIDAIVIDHHLVPPEPLPVLAFLNPHRPECGFAYKGLASCGLAFSLAAAVRRALNVSLDLRPYLDLVAIGTVADVAPLNGDNRVLVRAGLDVLTRGHAATPSELNGRVPRAGLRALAENAKLTLANGVSAEDVAFRIAPRLNAPGRLGDPTLSLDLLLAPDMNTAVGLAAAVEQLAVQRRSVQEKMLTQAVAQIEADGWGDQPAIVLAAEGWRPGIVGIVAGRIASRYGKPTIVIALEGPAGRGSVRGPQGARLHDALTRCAGELVGFGGHQAAAGVEVRGDRVGALRDAWRDAFASLAPSPCSAVGQADVRLDERDDPGAVADDLLRFEPCGEGNPAPRLLLRGATVRAAKNLKGHLKLELTFGRHAIGGFGFELGDRAEKLVGARVDVVGLLRRDAWKGGRAVEIRVEDVRGV